MYCNILFSGIWGLLAGPIFRSGGLLGENASDGLEMLLWNLIGMACIIAWNAVTSILLFGTLHKVGILRVKKDVEIMGLDAGKHDERAYPECKINKNEEIGFSMPLFGGFFQLPNGARPFMPSWKTGPLESTHTGTSSSAAQ